MRSLDGRYVFLSASVPHRPAWVEGVRPNDIEEAVVSLSRAVFARGGRLVFGGHPSISPLVAAVAGEYYPADPERPEESRPVRTYQSYWWTGPQIPNETWEMSRWGHTFIRWTEKGQSEADSLAVMRDLMMRETKPTVMVAIGGMEGIRDEADVFLRLCGGPVYVARSCAGAAAKLADEPRSWTNTLAPDPERPMSPEVLASLRKGAAAKRIHALEDEWMRAKKVPRLPGFLPFGSMMQWLVDESA